MPNHTLLVQVAPTGTPLAPSDYYLGGVLRFTFSALFCSGWFFQQIWDGSDRELLNLPDSGRIVSLNGVLGFPPAGVPLCLW